MATAVKLGTETGVAPAARGVGVAAAATMVEVEAEMEMMLASTAHRTWQRTPGEQGTTESPLSLVGHHTSCRRSQYILHEPSTIAVRHSANRNCLRLDRSNAHCFALAKVAGAIGVLGDSQSVVDDVHLNQSVACTVASLMQLQCLV